jgi:predicted metal-dependent phosphoesterase TrpH
VLIDFHCHTRASDGALSPEVLVDRALHAGIAWLAITDHDGVAGFQAARRHYTAIGGHMALVSGVELSCRWSGVTVHVVGLGFEAEHPAMAGGLAVLDQARLQRARAIADRLASRGIEGALEGALAEAGQSQLGRPHFASWLVRHGHFRDHRAAFDRFLGQGKPGDVKTFWPELDEVVSWIRAAGGAAVLAHPLKYRLTRTRLRRLLGDFRSAGGNGLEIITGRLAGDQCAALVGLAREFELEASVGSDFHRDHPHGPALGVELPPLRGLRGVWERWQ